MKKRIFSFSLFLIFMLLAIPMPTASAAAYAGEDTLASAYIAVIQVERGVLVFEKDADTKTAPGATAKLMTALLAIERFGDELDHMVTVTGAALRDLEGSAVLGEGLRRGEEISIRDLLYALLVVGANDAACVLAIEVSGNIPDFVKEMNRRAHALGATHTLYLNPTGLDVANAVTTASDTAKIAACVYQNPTLREMSSTRVYTVGATNLHDAVTIYSKNYLLSTQYGYYDAKAEGLSVGYTEKAGYTIVSAHSDGAPPYVCVAMKSEKDADGKIGAYTDVRKLLSWASANFTDRKLLDNAKILQELPVTAGAENHVLIVPADPVYAFLDKDADLSALEIRQEYETDTLTAPVEKGTAVGTAHLFLDGEEIAAVPLVTRTAVHKSAWKSFGIRVRRILKGTGFFIFITAVVVLLTITLLLRGRRKKRK